MRRVVVGLVVLVAALGVQVPARSEVPPPGTVPNFDQPLAVALDQVGLLDDWVVATGTTLPLALVPVDSPALAEGRAAIIARSNELAIVVLRQAELEVIEVELLRRLDALDLRLDVLAVEFAALQDRLGVVEDAIIQGATQRYVLFGTPRIAAPGGVEAENRTMTDVVLVRSALDEVLTQRRDLEGDQAGVVAQREALGVARFETAIGLEEARAEAVALAGRRIELETELPPLVAETALHQKSARIPALGLSVVTIDAYVRAAETLAFERPECGLRWQGLAGIGRVESNHGLDQGAVVTTDGRLTVPFYGPLLDGSLEGTAEITDTDAGSLDGSADFDRAVGPMQFIPSTWRSFARDGSGDGAADPHNLYDAALSAANYLCAITTPLVADGELVRGFLGYNPSQVYAETVLVYTNQYDGFQVASSPELLALLGL